MRGLTLWQPWAAAIALGDKQNETRSWTTSYRGLVAIHSAKKWDKALLGIARSYGLAVAGDPDRYLIGSASTHQAVVAVANLVRCEVMTEQLIERQTEHELILGDWKPGRAAWVFEDVRPLVDPYPLLGKQGLWKIPPAQVEAINLLLGAVPS